MALKLDDLKVEEAWEVIQTRKQEDERIEHRLKKEVERVEGNLKENEHIEPDVKRWRNVQNVPYSSGIS